MTRANAFLLQSKCTDAERVFTAVLTAEAQNADALLGRGNARFALGRANEALADFAASLAAAPHYAGAAYNMGFVLRSLGRREEALVALDRALAIRPDYADALNLRGVVLTEQNAFGEALAAFEELAAIAPEYPEVLGNIVYASGHVARWDVQERVAPLIIESARQGKRVAAPLCVLSMADDPELQRACARIQSQHMPVAEMPKQGARRAHEKIRVAYLSANFHDHAVAYLMAGVIEAHDRRAFEIACVSFGPPDIGAMRGRIVAASDDFIDVRTQSDNDVASLLRTMEVDIAVDLMGHTGDSRPAILAQRPAAVQVNYLGYPGTMGARFIDYIVADRFVIAPDRQHEYDERVAYLPDVFQANDAKRPTIGDPPSRMSLGLPARGFVFCCFNNAYKISSRMFDVWMRLLVAIDGSVLWLFEANPAFAANIRQAAEDRGVEPSRIVFAPKASYAEYLNRYQAADLFLDTLPFNGGTTASDALWAGLPVLTCAGRAFAARMAGSLLTAAGIPDLVVDSLQAYEALALELARHSAKLAAFKQRLERGRSDGALFKTDRFTRNLEAAYRRMHEIAQSGSLPQAFMVAP